MFKYCIRDGTYNWTSEIVAIDIVAIDKHKCEKKLVYNLECGRTCE